VSPGRPFCGLSVVRLRKLETHVGGGHDHTGAHGEGVRRLEARARRREVLRCVCALAAREQLEHLLVTIAHGARECARWDGGHHLDRGDERRAHVAGAHIKGDRPRELHGALVHAVQVVAYAGGEVFRHRDVAQVMDVQPSARGSGREERALVNHWLREEQKVLGHRVRVGHCSFLLRLLLCSSPL